VTAYLDLLLRGVGLSSQAGAIGGVFFIVLVLRSGRRADLRPLLIRSLWLVTASGVGVIIAQCLALVLQVESLGDEHGWPVREFLGTTYFSASVVRIVACAGLVAGCRLIGRGRGRTGAWTALAFSVALAAGSAGMSHAAARLDHRTLLLGLDSLHQLAAAVWVGGLVHLAAAAFRRGEPSWPAGVLRRFSATALGAVVTLVLAGVGLSFSYVDGLPALLGTGYGAMLLAKGVILAGLLGLGRANFLAVRRREGASEVSLVRVRRFVEVELGLGLVVFFVAASLTSLPPAVDVVAERATVAEVGARLAPRWPTLTSPTLDELPVPDRDTPRTAEDRAWSVYNHHVAGLVVLSMGLLATVQRLRWMRWARHWPLIFLGLASFLLMRNDPEAWPRGALGFWESLSDPVVFQHRVFVLLIAAFGVFEWLVRIGRFRAKGYALIFPLLCAVTGGLLLAHTHSADDLKEQLLIELSHISLGLLATFVAWARWLELRLPPPDDRLPGRLWAVGLSLVGVLLLLYRES
jgi:putative copper resistance protein D